MFRAALAISAALAATPALAGADTDYPHRDWGQVATLDMSLIEATSCITRELNRDGDATVIPADGGSDIDFAVRAAWGPKIEPWLTFKLREGEATTLRVFYRRPYSQGKVGKEVARLQERCLRVASIAPVADGANE